VEGNVPQPVDNQCQCEENNKEVMTIDQVFSLRNILI